MIQRVQSIYLLLAGLFPAITFFVPILHFVGENNQGLTMYSLGYDATLFPEMAGVKLFALAAFTFLMVLAPILTIFRYKKRRTQIQSINITFLFTIAWYIIFGTEAYSVMNETGLSLSFDVCVLLPLLGIVSLWMARRAIRKDEELIRAADRIR